MEDGKATTRLGYTTELDLTGYFLATEGGLTRITKFGQVWYIGQAIEILRPPKTSAYQWATPTKNPWMIEAVSDDGVISIRSGDSFGDLLVEWSNFSGLSNDPFFTIAGGPVIDLSEPALTLPEPLTTESGDYFLIDEAQKSVPTYSASYFGGIGLSDRNQIMMVRSEDLVFWDGESYTEKPFETQYTFESKLPIRLDFILGINVETEQAISGENIEAVQFNNQLILLSGIGPVLSVDLDFFLAQDVQKWNGNLDDFIVADENIPNGDFAVVTGNRLAIKTDHDTVSFSDIANESNFDVLNKFYIGAGDGDNISGFAPIPESALLVFKKRSIWAIGGLNNIGFAFVTQVSKQTGCISRHSIQAVGSSVFFLGDGGVYAMDVGLDASNAKGVLTRFALQDAPLSEPINDQILSEDFQEAETSCRSIFYNNRYYISFVDGDSSRVYIFNTILGAWESRDEYDFAIKDFVRAKLKTDRNERLFCITGEGQLFKLDEGTKDGENEIDWSLTTRSYDNQNLEIKNFRRGYVRMESLDDTGTSQVSVNLTDPDNSHLVPVERPANSGYIRRFSIGKRGNALSYTFSGQGRDAIKHCRAEFIENNNNLMKTYN